MENEKFFKIQTSDQVFIHVSVQGSGDPLLLLHGYPQSHLMWHKVKDALAEHFTLLMPDLRGYGNSSKPRGLSDHSNYSKRRMSQDMIEIMEHLGFSRFFVAAHDRGGRVAHRMALDYPQKIRKLFLLDLLPTCLLFNTVDKDLAAESFHWYFLTQTDDFPETMIGKCASYFYTEILRRWSSLGLAAFPPHILKHYIRHASLPESIHATCEDYRASASIDLQHDKEDAFKRISCPVYIMWSERSLMGKKYDILGEWRQYADQVEGKGIQCGHFIAEENPQEVIHTLLEWLGSFPKMAQNL